MFVARRLNISKPMKHQLVTRVNKGLHFALALTSYVLQRVVRI